MTTDNIIQHILDLHITAIFTTRDVLQYGTRSAVDQCLSRLVQSQFIFRLARGVFVRDPNVEVTIDEIAWIKAVAFGRCIVDHAVRILDELKLKKPVEPIPEADSETDTGANETQREFFGSNTFAIDGHSSRFQSCLGTIEFHGIAPRKRTLSSTKAGRRAYGLWYFGDNEQTDRAVRRSWRDLNRIDRVDLRRASALMPAWLHHLLIERYAPSVSLQSLVA